ncbi:MAG: hypothetical protein HQL31_08050, partial [Planctomycetes bacterium]|nr:hypothetical protein [Planctomycetota bacterium]
NGAMVFLGGGILLLGDPLARPFAREKTAQYEDFYNNCLGAEDEGEKLLNGRALLFWLLHAILQNWREGRLELAIGELQGAVKIRPRHSIFRETLADFLNRVGRTAELSKLLDSWSELPLSPYHEAFIAAMKKQLPSPE